MADRAINLTKGRSLVLEKGIRRLTVNLEWEENRRSTKTSEDFDIDLLVIELDSQGKALSPDHLVFFNSICETANHELCDPEEAVVYSGDNQMGGGEGEAMNVFVSKINPEVSEIRFFANIYDAEGRNQEFSMMKNAAVKVYQDGKDVPSIVYDLTDDYSGDTFIHVATLKKVEGRVFKFIAEGNGNHDDLLTNLTGFGLRFK
ncbi:MAG: TerD family protein [Bacilli bacterium]|nr:TerD family protein [Bacilli bacterium]